MKGRNQKTAAPAMEAAARREEAVRLRLAGYSYAQIGERLGVTKQAAHTYVSSSLADLRAATAEAAEDVREMELARLDAMLVPMLEAAEAGQQTAVDRVLRIQERRAKLLGLDAPTKSEVGGPGGGPVEIAGAKEALAALLARRTPAPDGA